MLVCEQRIQCPVDVVPFEPWHLRELALQPSQLDLGSTLTIQHGTALSQSGPCWTGMAGMDVIACAGVIEFWSGRSQVWALLSDQFPAHVKSVHRAVRQFLQGYEVARLECLVDPRNPLTIRWAEHLGFVYESTMPQYTPHGDTQLMMVRIR
jgi:hypothetical protein